MVFVEVLVFDGDGGLGNIFGKFVESDRNAVLVGKNFVEKLSVAVEN